MDKKEIEDYINSIQEEQMEAFWPLVNAFQMQDIPDPKEYGYKIGWNLALSWLGDILGLEIAKPDAESKAKIDSIFENLEKDE